MPFIQVKTNVEISSQQEEALKTKLGKAIALIPGKSENWLMLSFEDRCCLYFQGQKDLPIAFVEVKVFGKTGKDACGKLTGVITGILHDNLQISPDHVYIKYEEIDNWGWNGSNL